jgi:hypothetical protein
MTTRRKLLGLCSMVTAITVIFFACSKDDSLKNEPLPPGKQEVQLYLTDDPALFDKVLIDIKSVQVFIDTCDKNKHDDDDDDHGRGHDDDDHEDHCVNWDTLNIAPGIYDLLGLRNGVDTLLASGIIPEGNIKKIKIVLGNNNSLVKDSVTYPLDLFPGTQSTIILKIKGRDWDEWQPGRNRLWLDFDVSRSIFVVRGKFYLKPFLKIFTVKTTGSLEGRVLPKDAYPVISVYNAQDTGYAIPWHNGDFKVRGLQEGTYSVFINGSNGYQDTTITGVEIKRNRETDLPKITLHK